MASQKVHCCLDGLVRLKYIFQKKTTIFSSYFNWLTNTLKSYFSVIRMSLVVTWIIIIIYFSRTYQIPEPKMHLNYFLFNLVFWLQKWKLYTLVSDGKLWKHTVSIALCNVSTKSFLSLVSNSRALSMTFLPLVFFYLFIFPTCCYSSCFSFGQRFSSLLLLLQVQNYPAFLPLETESQDKQQINVLLVSLWSE